MMNKPMPYSKMETDISVSMDDVVSAFVATYENNLFERKKDLSYEIKELTKEAEALDKEALASVDGSAFEVENIKPFNLSSTVTDKALDWNEKHISFTISIKTDKVKSSSYWRNDSLDIIKTKPLPKTLIKRHRELGAELEDIRGQLTDVLEAIKSIARKERQVRGKIAIRKLEESGYANLMDDPELKALVQLEEAD